MTKKCPKHKLENHPNSKFSCNHLNEVEFENFCYDLLGEMGFINLNWRKGTGLHSSPADRGRDIECFIEKTDIDDTKYFEKWLVECKHQKKGIPVEEIQGILSWSQAENPDVVLIIAANFLSNNTKDYLEKYEKENNPKYKIKFWEKPDLEKLSLSYTRLLKKYRIPSDFSFLSVLHPAHTLYLKEFPQNSLDFFLILLDELDPKKRDEAMGWVYHSIIRPRYKEPVTWKETMRELLIDDISYESFRKKCIEIRDVDIIDEALLVRCITNLALIWLIQQGDVTSIDDAIQSSEGALANFKKELKERPHDKEHLEKLVRSAEERTKKIPNKIEHTYEIYTYFCTYIIAPLLVEKLFSIQKEK